MRKIKPIKSTGDENVGTAYGEDVEKEIPSRKGMAGLPVFLPISDTMPVSTYAFHTWFTLRVLTFAIFLA